MDGMKRFRVPCVVFQQCRSNYDLQKSVVKHDSVLNDLESHLKYIEENLQDLNMNKEIKSQVG